MEFLKDLWAMIVGSAAGWAVWTVIGYLVITQSLPSLDDLFACVAIGVGVTIIIALFSGYGRDDY